MDGRVQVFYAVACVASLTCFYLKINVYIDLMRLRRAEFGIGLPDKGDEYDRKHFLNLRDTQHTVKMCYTNLLSGLLEDLPLGTLGGLYLYRVATMTNGGAKHLKAMAFVSTASSWFMLVRFYFSFC